VLRYPGSVPKVRVFLADDHPIVRAGLRALIDAQPDMEVVGEASDGTNVIDAVTESEAEVAVLDVAMPTIGGARATELLREARPSVKVLALSAHEERGYIEQMLAAGASGYVVKRAAAEELVRAIRAVARGDGYFDPSIARAIVSGLARAPAVDPRAARALSAREEDVLRSVARGLALKEIAAAMNVSVRTVETYRARAMEKTGLRSRADIVRYAAERGWLTA
jgi:DNA-binding NarL/FixJ family response regulator